MRGVANIKHKREVIATISGVPVSVSAEVEHVDLIAVPRPLLDDVLEDLYELKCDRDHWKDEHRIGRAKFYEALSERAKKVEALLGR